MRRALARLAALGVVILLAGCGGGGAPHTTPAKTWAGQVCGALAPWRSQIADLNDQAATEMKQATTPQQTRDNLVRLLDGAKRSTETARVKVAAAGVPDVDGGKVIADRYVSALAKVRDAYGRAHTTVQNLPVSPAESFYAGVTTAINTLNTEYSQAGLNTGALASTELRADFEEVPACLG